MTMTNYEKKLIEMYSMTTKEALEYARTKNWHCERRASTEYRWIVGKFDRRTQTQIDCVSNGFNTRRLAILDAIWKEFDPVFD